MSRPEAESHEVLPVVSRQTFTTLTSLFIVMAVLSCGILAAECLLGELGDAAGARVVGWLGQASRTVLLGSASLLLAALGLQAGQRTD